ncbi:glutathione S-transferase family protein [Rhizobiaceae bacterium n13]|uniref:Glutathione S-transferase family protein n=1 Tax=Ferirhizobium litorale TaxID=2927786 RepID=A0AAE3TZP5_9HYPH|nr:glutathione S-transferase family protein [Fererhizobium litorale]MDI7861072.1 glutathione S-transferase family protein [Fererhizobium litorale]MDI7921219.1 glutathione S-transferase family protein [Fererhizobium litorale]
MNRVLYSLCGSNPARPFSPHCWKVVMALEHKGLAFEEMPRAFTAIPEIEGGATATVPLLNDNGRLVKDSFDIALYLDETYPDRPTLFGGEGGKAMARFVESYSLTVLHSAITRIAVKNIHDIIDHDDQVYFRKSREARLGMPLEEVAAARDEEISAFPAKLQPLRQMLKVQPFIGGDGPLFADYIVFGALQWLRITSGSTHLEADDPVSLWFERCLDLHQGRGRSVTAA